MSGDARPTLAAPDDDPYLWLEAVDGAAALDWVAGQNAATLRAFDGPAVRAEAAALAAVWDRADNIPFVTRRGGWLYNFWRDAVHVRGLWRRTTLADFRSVAPAWEVVLDLDVLAAAEGADWVFHGAAVLPVTHDRAMLALSRGGGDAVMWREFDLAGCAFVPDGFVLPEAKGGVDWLDRDTLLVSSAYGAGMATEAGYGRTVRVWRRGEAVDAARVVFEAPAERMGVWGEVDRDDATTPLIFTERHDFFRQTIWRGELSGARQRLALPEDVDIGWSRGWLALRPRSAWTVGAVTHAAGCLLGIGWAAFLAGSREFTVLFRPGPRRMSSQFSWVDGRLLFAVLDNLLPQHFVVWPEQGWRIARLPGLPEIGVVSVSRLDEDEAESDGSLLATVQDPLQPMRLLLTDLAGTPPALLKSAPVAFDATGLVVSRHEAISADGTSIPYFQVGPAAHDGRAPVHLYGYGGFEVSMQPIYRSAIGRLWLERGGVSVVAHLRGGGEFGPDWHRAGIRAGKARTHDDFAAVAADLVARGVTVPGRIAAEAGSNGGILITNMLTRYPERFGALFCTIPLVDMRRYNKLLAGASWMAEYGNPDLAEDWAFLQHISAYHTAVPNPDAPPILLATTRRDDRVHPGHARKMAAKLQAMGQRAWFYELDSGGHGYGKTNADRAHFTALGYAFLRQSIGWA